MDIIALQTNKYFEHNILNFYYSMFVIATT